MDAKDYNTSIRALFFGSPLVWAYAEMDRQLENVRLEHTEERRRIMDNAAMQIIECPCGCGLKDGICEEQAERVRISNEEIPF